jgi:hypothetical protein
MAKVEADEMGAAAAKLRDVRVKRRADGHLVDPDHERRPRPRDRRHLEPLLVELRAQLGRRARQDPGERVAEIEPGRQPADAAVAGLGPAQIGELAEAKAHALGDQAAIAALQPGTERLRHGPDDAVVVERELVSVGKQAQRREFPGDALGHARVEHAPDVVGDLARHPPADRGRDRSGPAPRLLRCDAVDADDVARLGAEQPPGPSHEERAARRLDRGSGEQRGGK